MTHFNVLPHLQEPKQKMSAFTYSWQYTTQKNMYMLQNISINIISNERNIITNERKI